MDCLYGKDEEKLHLTDPKNKGTGNSHNKKVLYEPEGMDRCKQYVCSQKRAILVVAVMMIFIITVAIIASLARPFAGVCPGETNVSKHTEKPKQTYIATNGKIFPWKDIRLPKTVLPISYALQMHPNLTTFLFKGSVEIVVKPVEKTDFIVFHSKKLNVTKLDLTETDSNNGVNIVEKLEYVGHEQVYLKLGSELNAHTKYTLKLTFDGALSSGLAGFYKSSYKTSTGNQVWLATTHFEATDARAAFPCFDEPEMKAVFSMKMTRDTKHISLFNTPKVQEVLKTDGLIEDHFSESVKMSTYLVAFVVCDYKNLSDTTNSNIKVSVYAPPELIEQARYALECAVSILDYYEDFFGVKYPMPKQDLIAIPDFAAGAMENWGLITYRMTALLYDPDVSSAFNKQWVAVVVAHELAHQWFGNLVTMKWWNDLWLNEGFASFTEYLGTDHKEPGWDMLDQFITVTLVAALHSDSLSSSHPISVVVSDPAEIAQIFDHISYDKGSSVIRMLESFITRDVLQSGLKHYLNELKFQNAATDDLWQSFSQAAKSKNMNINVKDIMDTWTLQMGYPLVKISRNGNQITATQQRFLLNPRGNISKEFKSPYDYKWFVPLTYITDKDSSDSKIEWMKMGSVSFNVPAGTNWVKFNTNMTGFYRVHYDATEWKAITDQMKADHTKFHIADRASLIDDAFQLSQAGHVDIVDALELSTYLLKEVEYVPWHVALENLQYIGLMLEERPSFQYYAKYVKNLIQSELNKLGWDDKGPQLIQYLRSFLLSTAVRLNHKETVQTALSKYRAWMTKGEKLPVNLKNVIYHAGIQYGGEKEWEYAWQSYKNTSVPSEKKKFLYALAATTDALRLNRYLHLSLDENEIRKGDIIIVISSIASNPAGRVLAWRFVKQHWEHFKNIYGKGSFDMPTLILRTTSKFTTQYDHDEVKSFYESHDTGSGSRAVSQVLESIEMNIDWLKNNKQKCVDWLKKQVEQIEKGSG